MATDRCFYRVVHVGTPKLPRIRPVFANQCPEVSGELVADETGGRPTIPIVAPLASPRIADPESLLTAPVVSITDGDRDLTATDAIETGSVADVCVVGQ